MKVVRKYTQMRKMKLTAADQEVDAMLLNFLGRIPSGRPTAVELKFRKSWNWLLPVIIKLQSKVLYQGILAHGVQKHINTFWRAAKQEHIVSAHYETVQAVMLYIKLVKEKVLVDE